MRYFCPNTLSETVEILAQHRGARCLAGGASLMPMLNNGIIEPEAIVSLRRVADLQGIVITGETIRIGAMTLHKDVANDHRLTGRLEVLRQAANRIGHPAIRAVGTIGGSAAHGDPAADYPTALLALNAEIEILNTHGVRRIPASEFFVGALSTALRPADLITAVTLTVGSREESSAYLKVTKSAGDFSTVSIAVVGTFRERQCDCVRIVVGGCGATPVNVAAVDTRISGERIGSDAITQAAESLANACDPNDDIRGSANYRRELVRRLLPKALEAAAEHSLADR